MFAWVLHFLMKTEDCVKSTVFFLPQMKKEKNNWLFCYIFSSRLKQYFLFLIETIISSLIDGLAFYFWFVSFKILLKHDKYCASKHVNLNSFTLSPFVLLILSLPYYCLEIIIKIQEQTYWNLELVSDNTLHFFHILNIKGQIFYNKTQFFHN